MPKARLNPLPTAAFHILLSLADADLHIPREQLRRWAGDALSSHGFDVAGYDSASALGVNGAVLDYIEPEFGRDQTQAWIREGAPLVYFQVMFRRRGDPDGLNVEVVNHNRD